MSMTLQETAFPDDPGGSKVVFDSLWFFCASYTQDVSCGLAMAYATAFAEVWVLYLACRSFPGGSLREKCIVSRGAPETGVDSALLSYILQRSPDYEMWRTHLLLPSQHCYNPCSSIQTWASLLRFLNSSWLPDWAFPSTFFRGLLLAFLCSWWELCGLSLCEALMIILPAPLSPPRADISSTSKQSLGRLPFQGVQPALPSYHINRAKGVPQLLRFSSTLHFLFGVLRGLFTGRGNTSSNCVLAFKHRAGGLLLAQVSDREKIWLICNKEGSRVCCVLRIRGSRQDYSWKGCLLRAQCI